MHRTNFSAIQRLLLILVIATSCKKNPIPDFPEEYNTHHETINSALAYGQSVSLHTADKKAAILFGTTLLMNNGLPHQVFSAKAASQSGNKLMVSNQNIQPLGTYWASSLNQGFVIYEQASGLRRWTAPQEAALLLAIIDEGSTVTFKGPWANKQRLYLGITLLLEDGAHHGWVCISHQPDEKSLQIHDWAYHKKPNIPLKAGYY